MRQASESSPDRLLGIFAKEPIAGQVKTRLAQGTSSEWAQRVAEACLEDWLDRLVRMSDCRVIAHAPATAQPYFTRWVSAGYQLFPQGEGDLGERLRHFFMAFGRPHCTRIVVVGTDSPTLPLALIEQAFMALETRQVVLGPSSDGGYYLIGACVNDAQAVECGSQTLSMFDAIPWSSVLVLEKTVQRLQAAGLSLELLPPWYDVDTLADWNMLRGHVLAMRYAGIDPEVPRLERLIQEESR